MPITLYTFEEFAETHGDYVDIGGEFGQRFVFADSATSDGRYTHHEPPTDPVELLRVRRDYLKSKLTRQENNARKCASYIEGQAQYHKSGVGPAPQESDFDDLKRFKASVIDLRERLAETEAELRSRTAPPPAQHVNQRRMEEMAHADNILSRLRAETDGLDII